MKSNGDLVFVSSSLSVLAFQVLLYHMSQGGDQ
jgi:hypothetical protein